MVYTAIPDRRIPYDNDGSVVGWWYYPESVRRWITGSELTSLNALLPTVGSGYYTSSYLEVGPQGPIFFFPEQREITAYYVKEGLNSYATEAFRGSNNSGNGTDGTWETASIPAGSHQADTNFTWRMFIVHVSFTGPKKVLRVESQGPNGRCLFWTCHLYGEKAAGQTPDDLIYINHDDTPGVEYAAAEDFGYQALGTTVVRQFRVKNVSPTKSANTINIQCNDTDFAISENGSTWVVTINLASLAAGAESPTYYVRCTTPSPGGLLGPRFARIVTTVASYT